MNMNSYLSYLSSEDNYFMNKDELSDDFNFDEKILEFQISQILLFLQQFVSQK